MPTPKPLAAIILACVFLPQFSAAADALKMPALFSDNMVLQGGKNVPIWGKAAPQEKVTLQYAGHTATAVADGNGAWHATLDLANSPKDPFDMTVSGDKSASPITIKNVAAGEVWLASGQSNMFKPIGPGPSMQPNDNWQQVVAESANPQIRVFTVGMRPSEAPLGDCGGKWEVASPQTTAHFTAAGYFFAHELNKQLHVPIGVIHSSWGGTRAEPWTSLSGFSSDPDLSAVANEEIQAYTDHPNALKQYDAAVAQWAQSNHYSDPGNSGEKSGFANPSTGTSDWKPVGMGSAKITPGIHWYRTAVNIPADWEGKPLFLRLATLSGFDTVYFNNTRVGGIDLSAAEKVGSGRTYQVPANLVKGGPATVAIRLVSFLPAGGVMNPAWQTAMVSGNAHQGWGPWVTKTELDFPALDPAAIAAYPKLPPDLPNWDTATHLFNGMINPLIPYGIAGVLWYQGESNADLSPWVLPAHPNNRAYQGDHPDPAPLYRKLLPALINDWRDEWKKRGGNGDFPFYYCQLANYKKKQLQPSESAWAEVRESQRVTLGSVPNTGMAVLIDIGFEKDIHPTDKEDVGSRLALWALAQTYGHKLEDSGPLYQSMKVEGNKIRVAFSHSGTLTAKELPDNYQPQTVKPDTVPLMKPLPDSPLQGFEISGSDGKFVWAHASIEGNTVVVSSQNVSRPTAVRYAWADNPTCNLYNDAGLPASPFRTDNWWPK